MSTAFPDVTPFPSATGPAQVGMGHNRPPLDQLILADFEDALAEAGLKKRITDLIASAGRAGACDSDDKAGKIADLAKLFSAATKAVEAEREKLNRPILTAQRALKGRADAYAGQLADALRPVRAELDRWMVEQRRIADEARRKAEEEARAAAEAERQRLQAELDRQAEDGDGDADFAEVAPIVEPEPVKVEAPVVRGDYGARIGSRTVWLHEIEGVRKLPNNILNHEKVVAAINQVVGAMVRGGAREIKGVRVWSEQRTDIR